MTERYWATVEAQAGRQQALPYKAFEGLPDGPQKPLPIPDVLLIDQQPEGYSLIGYTANGEFTGDTWHQDLDEAKGQAEFAYGPYLGSWKAIPNDVQDAVGYALDQREDG